MNRQVFTLLTLFWTTGPTCFAQNAIDSLKNEIRNTKNDSIKVDVQIKLGQELTYSDTDQAMKQMQNALDLAQRIGYDIGACEAYTGLAYINRIQSRWDQSLNLFLKASDLAEKINYKQGMIDGYIGRGNIYQAQGKWSTALNEHSQALEIASGINDAYHMASALNNIGNIYLETSEYEKALEHYQKGLSLWTRNERVTLTTILNISQIHFRLRNYQTALNYIQRGLDSATVINAVDILALCHKNMGQIQRAQGQFDSALLSYDKALSTYQSVDNRRAVAEVTSNIGNIYFEKQDFNKAIEMYDQSLAVQTDINAQASQTYTLAALGMTYKQLNNLVKGEEYLKKAHDLASKVNVPVIVMDAAESLSDLYAQQGRFEEAYEQQLIFKSINDSLVNTRKNKQIAEMEAKYETAQKEKEIELLNASNTVSKLKIANRENQRNFLIILLIAVLSLGVVLYNRYKEKGRANRKLKELDTFKTNFVTNISHEFRTPLTLIIGPLERLILEETDQAKREQYGIMDQNARRVLDLINQLLDLSKIDAGSLELKISKGDIYAFISSLAHSFTSLAEQSNINFLISIPEGELEAFFDRDKLQKIIYNLLSNAFKFTPDNGNISVVVENEHKSLTLKIIDSGCGIAEGMKDKIFERFQQLDDQQSKSYQGSGIGLALTRELVELHHGTITVHSELNKGSEFVVVIPLELPSYEKSELVNDESFANIQESSTALAQESRSEVEDAKSVNQPIILIVEDNDQVRNYIRSVLENNYGLLEASNGLQGFLMAKEHIPDLIISDLMMPEMDGRTFAEKVRNDECTSHIPIVMLTAKADLDSRLDGLKTGIDDYLTKPFHSDELTTRIDNLIVQRRKLRERFGTSITLEPQEIDIMPPDAAFLTKASKIVEESMQDDDFNVEAFQREIGMSRMQLHRKLKALIDCSASEFIRDQRLKRAAQILQTSGISVSEAAYQTGFNNLSYFAKCFKEKFGIPPSEYHNETQN